MTPVAAILGPGGAIARTLKNYEPRREQIAMAEAVADAFAQRRHLMVEAGTGVGKSFGYLIPALLAAAGEKEFRVVVSTHTISLQEQLIGKDLPFLQRVMPQRFNAMLVKGRSNYLSKRRLRVAHQRAASLLGEVGEVDQLDTLLKWDAATRDGSRSDLEFRPLVNVWDLVASDSANCLGKKCLHFDECHYFKARRHLQTAQVLVVNHALFFADLRLRSLSTEKRELGILPKYHAVIFDEAHTLEDVAAEHFGLSVTRGQVEFLFNRLLHERRGHQHGLLSMRGDPEARDRLFQARHEAQTFFQSLAAWSLGQRPGGRINAETVRLRSPGVVPNRLSDALKKLGSQIALVAEQIKSDELQMEYDAAAGRCLELAETLDQWLQQELPAQVYWMENLGEQARRLTLSSAPIEVGPLLRARVFDSIPTVILASATLNVGGRNGFGFFKDRLSFPDHPTLQLGSPFDYETQAELHLFRAMPDPTVKAAEFEAACVEKIRELVIRNRGRAFVLFTSIQSMQRAADHLRVPLEREGLTLLSQSDGASPSRLLEKFRQTEGAVLFGVDSFWQGVDVQGEALTLVIITKLPFLPPDRPLVEARNEAIDARGGNPFHEAAVPQAILKLKQGFGRLIRTGTDHGKVAVLDPRLLIKPYGRRFLDALPNCPRWIDGERVPD